METLFKVIKFFGMFSFMMILNILLQTVIFLGQNLKTENYNWIAWLTQILLLFISLALTVKWYEEVKSKNAG